METKVNLLFQKITSHKMRPRDKMMNSHIAHTKTLYSNLLKIQKKTKDTLDPEQVSALIKKANQTLRPLSLFLKNSARVQRLTNSLSNFRYSSMLKNKAVLSL